MSWNCYLEHCVKSVEIRSFFWSVFSRMLNSWEPNCSSYTWSESCRLCYCIHCVKNVQKRSNFWSVFSRIRTEYGEILRICPYSVRMRKNTDQKLLRILTLCTYWSVSGSGLRDDHNFFYKNDLSKKCSSRNRSIFPIICWKIIWSNENVIYIDFF